MNQSAKSHILMKVLEWWSEPKSLIQKLISSFAIHRFNKAHKVIFLFPYRTEFNPIEFGWAQMKGFVAKAAA